MRTQSVITCCVISILFMALAFSGCLEDDERTKKGDLAILPPEKLRVIREECYMSGVGKWNADFAIKNTFRDRTFPVTRTEITSPSITMGNGSQGPAYTIIDGDSNGLLTSGDHILFFNLTENEMVHQNLSCDGEWVTCFLISWDDGDPMNYLVRTSSVVETLEPDGTYSAQITLWMREGDSGLQVHFWLMIPDFRLGFLSANGTVLAERRMTYEDADRDKSVSDGDLMKVRGMTRDYHRCQVQFIHDNRLIGWTVINLPGID